MYVPLMPQGRTCHSAVRKAAFDIQSRWKSELHLINAESRWTLRCQKHSVYIKYWPQSPQSFALAPVAFEIQGCGKSQMNRITSFVAYFTVKSTLYTLNITSQSQMVSFALRLAVFEIQGVENQKCSEWPPNNLKHLSVNKYPLYTTFLPLSVSLYDQPIYV